MAPTLYQVLPSTATYYLPHTTRQHYQQNEGYASRAATPACRRCTTLLFYHFTPHSALPWPMVVVGSWRSKSISGSHSWMSYDHVLDTPVTCTTKLLLGTPRYYHVLPTTTYYHILPRATRYYQVHHILPSRAKVLHLWQILAAAPCTDLLVFHFTPQTVLPWPREQPTRNIDRAPSKHRPWSHKPSASRAANRKHRPSSFLHLTQTSLTKFSHLGKPPLHVGQPCGMSAERIPHPHPKLHPFIHACMQACGMRACEFNMSIYTQAYISMVCVFPSVLKLVHTCVCVCVCVYVQNNTCFS